MKNLAMLGVLALAIAPGAGLAQSATMGDGIHGYDFLIGSWSCANSNPGPMTGPASATIVGAAAGAHNAIVLHLTGTGLDSTSYISYDPKTKVWSSPAASSDGTWGVTPSPARPPTNTSTSAKSTPAPAGRRSPRSPARSPKNAEPDPPSKPAGGAWFAG
jgi:hypothetical protein